MYSFVNKAWIYSRGFFSGGRVCIKICLHSCILLIYNHLLEKAWQRLHYIYNTIQISPPLKMWKMILWKTDFFYLTSTLVYCEFLPLRRPEVYAQADVLAGHLARARHPSLGRCLPQALHQGGTGLRVSLCQFPSPWYRYARRLRQIPPPGYRCDRRLHHIIENVIGEIENYLIFEIGTNVSAKMAKVC